jgi:hypothetical protein
MWFLSVLFNGALGCWVYIASVMNEWGGSTGGRILSAENWSVRRKTCPSATFSTRNFARSGLGLNPHLRGDRLATGRVFLNINHKLYLFDSVSNDSAFLLKTYLLTLLLKTECYDRHELNRLHRPVLPCIWGKSAPWHDPRNMMLPWSSHGRGRPA